ncbi:MAG TPA: twin-arginine translocase subunit TatC [Galbitalea sp.]|jgi:sec-independent protein translocase protein TatC|nr:twin-arginine translocase subunit TatC [Galbitalea sp.]
MSLRAHLVELRKRLVIAAVAVVVASIGCWFLVRPVFNFLIAPVAEAAKLTHRHVELNFPGLTSPFDIEIQLAITMGIVVSSPIWLYELWAFIVPGLKKRERRYVYGFLGSAIPLFLIGCAIGWILLPRLVDLLTSFAPAESTSFISTDDYVSFITKLMIAVGIGFVLPVVLVFLNFIGILASKSILKGWRIAVLLVVVFAAIVTPSADIISMFALALPIIALYFVAVLITHLHDRAVARRLDAFSAEIAA